MNMSRHCIQDRSSQWSTGISHRKIHTISPGSFLGEGLPVPVVRFGGFPRSGVYHVNVEITDACGVTHTGDRALRVERHTVNHVALIPYRAGAETYSLSCDPTRVTVSGATLTSGPYVSRSRRSGSSSASLDCVSIRWIDTRVAPGNCESGITACGGRVEPEVLRRGRAFHRRVQAAWAGELAGAPVQPEHRTLLCSGARTRHGRLDLFVSQVEDFVTVIEIKSTDWDVVRDANRRKLLAAHCRQVLQYVDAYLRDVNVCAALLYPYPPSTPGLRERIEEYVERQGLPVIWYESRPDRLDDSPGGEVMRS